MREALCEIATLLLIVAAGAIAFYAAIYL